MESIVLFYDQYHDTKAVRLLNRLQEMKIHALRCTQLTPPAEREAMVRAAGFLFVLLVDDDIFPRSFVDIVDALGQEARNRDKQLYIIKEYRAALPPDFQGYPILEPEDGTMTAPQGGGVAGMIANLIIGTENKQVLYEKLSAMMTIDYRPGIQEILCDLCKLVCGSVREGNPALADNRELLWELLRILESMAKYPTGYGEEQKTLARKMLDSVSRVTGLLVPIESSRDPYLLAWGLRVADLYREIRADCVDTTTGGDVDLYGKPVSAEFENRCRRMGSLLLELSKKPDLHSTQDEFALIQTTLRRMRDRENWFTGASDATEPIHSQAKQPAKNHQEEPKPLTETERKLHSIAEFMSKGYSLFETMSGDETAADFLRCLKTSFERLKNYCDIVETKAISAQCIDYIVRIDQQLARLNDVEDSQDKAGLGLKALLGLKLPQSGQYDVFLSYKHEDVDIVRNVYHFLKSKLLNVFFDKVTLPELSESDYDEAIMKALDHSRHFLVIITDLAQLDTYWIKLEMKTFHHEIVEGRKENSNFIMLVTDRVYQEIVSSNKTVLPLRYRSCEIMRISDYKAALPGYMTK